MKESVILNKKVLDLLKKNPFLTKNELLTLFFNIIAIAIEVIFVIMLIKIWQRLN